MTALTHATGYELCFCMQDGRCAYAFPCDAAGKVDMDAMSDRTRINYLYARAVMGFEHSEPSVHTRCV